jgi:protein-S-isoprenylcysteine O-methyltransferase Ste14
MTDAPTTRGPDLPVLPPILLLGALILAIILDFLPLHFMAVPVGVNAQTVIGAIVFLIGLVLGGAAVRLFRRKGTSPNPRDATKLVVTDGPYRFTRNPMYLGFVLVLLGIALVFSLEWGVILTPFLWLALDRMIITREEAYLTQHFGEDYEKLLRQTRRWL